MEENYDSTWLLYNPGFVESLTTASPEYKFEKMTTYWPETRKKITSDMLTNKIKETPVNTVLTEQAAIDAEVREAIAAPRRAREVARRVAAVNALGIDDTHDDGAVLRFKRKFGSNEYTYAALRAAGMWYMTGTNSNHAPHTWESLTEWMTTGENMITDLEVVAGWATIDLSAPVADAS